MKLSVEMRIKNGHLAEAIERRGWTAVKAAEFCGVPYYRMIKMINLQATPNGLSETQFKKLQEILGEVPMEAAFPEELQSSEFKGQNWRIKKTIEADPSILLCANARPKLISPAQQADFNRGSEIIESVLSSLTDREARVIRGIFYDGETKSQIAKELGVCITRVTQIEQKALNRMRRPERRHKLIEASDVIL